MKIQIKKKHIEQGKRGRSTLCPIALALKEKGFECVKVNAETVEVDGTDLVLSKQEARFVELFDDGRPVKPFVFRLKFS